MCGSPAPLPSRSLVMWAGGARFIASANCDRRLPAVLGVRQGVAVTRCNECLPGEVAFRAQPSRCIRSDSDGLRVPAGRNAAVESLDGSAYPRRKMRRLRTVSTFDRCRCAYRGSARRRMELQVGATCGNARVCVAGQFWVAAADPNFATSRHRVRRRSTHNAGIAQHWHWRGALLFRPWPFERMFVLFWVCLQEAGRPKSCKETG